MTSHTNTITVITVGEPGPPGVQGLQGTSGSGDVEIPFSYGDVSPMFIVTALAGKVVMNVTLCMDTAFDGVGAVVTVGDTGQPDRLMSASDADVTTGYNYETHPCYVYGADTSINLSITPGAGATQGSGIVRVHIQS